MKFTGADRNQDCFYFLLFIKSEFSLKRMLLVCVISQFDRHWHFLTLSSSNIYIYLPQNRDKILTFIMWSNTHDKNNLGNFTSQHSHTNKILLTYAIYLGELFIHPFTYPPFHVSICSPIHLILFANIWKSLLSFSIFQVLCTYVFFT